METAVVCDFHDSNKGECIARLDMHLPGPWLGANTDDNRYKEDDFLVVFSRKGETNIKVADFWPGGAINLARKELGFRSLADGTRTHQRDRRPNSAEC